MAFDRKFRGRWVWMSLLAAALWSHGTVARAQTVIARGFLLDNTSNEDVAGVVWGARLMLRGPIVNSPVLLRISVDRAMGNTDRVRRPCSPMQPVWCGANAPSSRTAVLVGGAGLSVPVVGDPRTTRTSVSVIGDVQVGELHLLLTDTDGTVASMFERVKGGAAGVSMAWKPKVTSPLSIEAEVMLGGLNMRDAGNVHGYNPKGFNFRRYGISLTWLP
ncbi:MAG TPA: hypothetical protein VGE27_03320 [Gemmatimonas sp.]|uniref:hypothetical protein n=1 Tax=Gemmatimonas sp. TaxID=1962908 RepID=UPI002ED93046